jgi:hypothetical protein
MSERPHRHKSAKTRQTQAAGVRRAQLEREATGLHHRAMTDQVLTVLTAIAERQKKGPPATPR